MRKILAALLALAGVARADGGFVLVWKNAWLYSDAAEGAPRARAIDLEAHQRPAFPAAVWPMRKLGEKNGFVEVESLGKDEVARHCYRLPEGLAALKLRLFVRPGDLAQVTARETTVALEEGTGVKLSAGVTLVPVGEGRVLASTERVQIPLPSPPPTTARAYDPSRPLVEDVTRAKFTLAHEEAGAVVFGGQKVRLRESGVLLGVTHKPHRRGRLVTLRDECSEVKVVVAAKKIEKWEGVSGIFAAGPKGRAVKRGAIVSWPDGRRAGIVDGELVLGDPIETRSDGRVCGKHPLRPFPQKPEQSLTLCFAASDLQPK